jgi:hypothetical protein
MARDGEGDIVSYDQEEAWLDRCAALANSQLNALPEELVGPAGRLLRLSLAISDGASIVPDKGTRLAAVAGSASRRKKTPVTKSPLLMKVEGSGPSDE